MMNYKVRLISGLISFLSVLNDNIIAESGAIKQYSDQVSILKNIFAFDKNTKEEGIKQLQDTLLELGLENARDIAINLYDFILSTEMINEHTPSLAHIIKEEEEHKEHFISIGDWINNLYILIRDKLKNKQ